MGGRGLLFVLAGFIGVVALYAYIQPSGLSFLLGRSTEEVTLPPSTQEEPTEAEVEPRTLEIVTILGFDAIPAILDPEFVTAQEASLEYDPEEEVLGVSINGEHRAYPIKLLSRHEIVNDVVGGVPIAVTW